MFVCVYVINDLGKKRELLCVYDGFVLTAAAAVEGLSFFFSPENTFRKSSPLVTRSPYTAECSRWSGRRYFPGSLYIIHYVSIIMVVVIP